MIVRVSRLAAILRQLCPSCCRGRVFRGMLASWELVWAALAAWGVFLLLVPAVFRYSRIIWMHFDHYFHPETSERPKS